MGFGRGKKRESWSSRPLSMILPDNVKLFNKKSKAVVEKAMQDQNKRGIDYELSNKNQRTIPEYGSVFTTNSEMVHAEEVQPINNQSSIDMPLNQKESTADGADLSRNPTPPETQSSIEAPYLTLNLGDTPSLLLDISDQISHISSHDSQDRVSVASESGSPSSDREIQDFHQKHFEGKDVQSHSSPYSAGQTRNNIEPGASDEPPIAEVAAIDLNQMPWAVNVRDTPVISETPSFEGAQAAPATASPDLPPQLEFDPGCEVDYSTLQPSNRQESTFSSDTQPSLATTSEEFVLEANRKIIVNRGVYIFDPTNTHDLVHATLSPDELFNPFDFE